MKKLLALLLAALLLSAFTLSCEKKKTAETAQSETKSEETAAETAAPETEESIPVPYSTALVTENGTAMAKIVLSETASALEKYAAEELRYHIEKVSGTSLEVVTAPVTAVTEAVTEAVTDVLPIVIGTPDSIPELETLFPEDVAWIRTLEEDGKSYGNDGFAIRTTNTAVYLFGATARGALNGVYDFIEENMGVLWLRANEDIGMIYDEQPTVTVTKTNYREKSPFQTRGWHLCGMGANGEPHSDPETEIMMSRNKLNGKFAELDCNEHLWSYYESIGLAPFNLGHNLKYWVLNSPLYDSAVTEYWNTDSYGNPYPIGQLSQINFWSELTLETVKESVLDYLRNNDTNTISVGVEDIGFSTNLPMSNEPFEYAPGQFVERSHSGYMSTVFFTFLNEIARAVKAEFPDVIINTFAYLLVENPPVCEIEDNVRIVIAPILEDMADPITDPDNGKNFAVHLLMEKWKNVANDVVIYNYYGSYGGSRLFERPIWDRMQSDFRYYASIGFDGLMPEGYTDSRSITGGWAMNTLTFWLYSKLAWNPEEDVDALIQMFCDRYYGEASEEMKEYYTLLEYAWETGDSSSYLWNYKLGADYYYNIFIYQTDLEDDFNDVLTRAYEAAESNRIRERIRPIREAYARLYAQFEG